MGNYRSEMRVIGLTGGIASGKSTVADILSSYGIPVIDADLLAREAVLPGSSGLRQIVEAFGVAVLQEDGSLDRKILAEKIFSDSAARRILESILHPAIKELAQKRLDELKLEMAPVAFYMAPLLVEAGVTDRVDEIWVVNIDRETQLERIQTRDSLSRSDAEKRLAAQMPMDEKAAYGRVVISNCGNVQELKERVVAVLRAERLGNGNREL
jgi:dephospho-CoA kinase